MENYIDNVYLTRKEKNEYSIFSNTISNSKKKYNAAIIIHLHYLERINNYFSYIDNIPDYIKVYITSSNENIIDELRRRYSSCINFEYRLKENRGRDISSFLVTCKDVFYKYKYVCFVHDKVEKIKLFEEDVKFWNENIWGNTIGSSDFINNVLDYLDSHSDCGLMHIPEPIGRFMYFWFGSSWRNDYDLVVELAEKMNLKSNIDRRYPPITLGTAFWCRTEAIKKLCDISWEYEDFPCEPLNDDGTISHAVERVLSYVVQDAGFSTRMIMSDVYAAKLFSFLQYYSDSAYKLLKSQFGITRISELEYINEIIPKMIDFFSKYRNVYIYGAGFAGKQCLDFLLRNKLEPKGFIISHKEDLNEVDGYPLYSLDEISQSIKDIGIIISVIDKNDRNSIIDGLKKYDFNDYIIWREESDQGIWLNKYLK